MDKVADVKMASLVAWLARGACHAHAWSGEQPNPSESPKKPSIRAHNLKQTAQLQQTQSIRAHSTKQLPCSLTLRPKHDQLLVRIAALQHTAAHT